MTTYSSLRLLWLGFVLYRPGETCSTRSCGCSACNRCDDLEPRVCDLFPSLCLRTAAVYNHAIPLDGINISCHRDQTPLFLRPDGPQIVGKGLRWSPFQIALGSHRYSSRRTHVASLKSPSTVSNQAPSALHSSSFYHDTKN